MKFSYKKVSVIDNSFQCPRCPIKVRRGTILYDRARDLQLLNLTVRNEGSVTVDEICVKVISYDMYGNVIPEKNGAPYQICSFSDSGCLPDRTIGENDVILLPSKEVVNCDVLVTHVVTAGNVEMNFTDEDYSVKNTPEPIRVNSEEKNRQLSKRLHIALIAVAGIYFVGLLSFLIVGKLIVPSQNQAYIDRCLKEERFEDAYQKAVSVGDEEQKQEILKQAIETSIAEEKFDEALSYASKSKDSDLQTETLERIVSVLESTGDFEKAIELATKQNQLKVKKRIYSDAITYYCNTGEFRNALKYVISSGLTERKNEVYSAAVSYYREKGEYQTAMDYALKGTSEENILSVYDDLIANLVTDGNYNLAALYLGKCNVGDTAVVNSTLIKEIIEKADDNYLILHAKDIYPILSFRQKQELFATKLAVSKIAVGITTGGKAVSTGEQYDVSKAVSVDCSADHVVFLLENGTVVAYGDNTYNQCATGKWTNIIAISCGDGFTVGIKEDGTAVGCGKADDGRLDVSSWSDMIQVSCGEDFTVGLRNDGTVVGCGANLAGQLNVSEWTDIVQISAGSSHVIALRSDGTAVTSGVQISAKCLVSSFKDLIAVAAGSDHSVGLTKDGTVLVATGGQTGISKPSYTNIVAIAAGENNLLALSSTGTVYSTGNGKVKTSALVDIAK